MGETLAEKIAELTKLHINEVASEVLKEVFVSLEQDTFEVMVYADAPEWSVEEEWIEQTFDLANVVVHLQECCCHQDDSDKGEKQMEAWAQFFERCAVVMREGIEIDREWREKRAADPGTI